MIGLGLGIPKGRNTGGGSADLVISPTTITIDNSAIEIVGLQAETINAYWENGKTYFMWRGDNTQKNELWCTMYDEDNGWLQPFPFFHGTGVDTHLNPWQGIDDSGNVYATQEVTHNGVARLIKSLTPEDVTAFEELAEQIGPQTAYNVVLKRDNGNFIDWVRYGGDYDQAIYKASSGMETWDSGTKVALHSGNHWLYPSFPNRYKVGSYYYLHIAVRTTPSTNYWMLIMVKTQDFDTYEGVGNSENRVISVSGAIPYADLPNWAYRNLGTDAGQLRVIRTDITPTGKVISVGGDGSGGWESRVFDGTSWSEKTISIANILDDGGGTTPFQRLMAISDTEIYMLVRIDNGGTEEIHRYLTDDLGDTWTYVDTMFSDVGQQITAVTWPYNYYDIPSNRNFGMIATGNPTSGGTPDYPSGYLKTAAFGGIQSLNPDTYTGYGNDMSAEFSWERLYYIESGKITEAGGVVSALLDQSGNGEDGACNGSPTWDSVDTLSFDGNNDEVVVPTTGIISNTKMVVVTVIDTQGQSGDFYHSAWSNSAQASRFALLWSNNMGGNSILPQTSVFLNGSDRYAHQFNENMYNSKAIIISVHDGVAPAKTYINGKIAPRLRISDTWGGGEFP